jgi:DNA-binding transcriptional ArsR family regulator
MHSALDAFAALSHPARLDVFRLLTARAPRGVPAGELAALFSLPPSTMTGHLQRLERAGLIASERRSKQIRYALNVEGARRLVAFLVEDCCGGRPEICGPLSADADELTEEKKEAR